MLLQINCEDLQTCKITKSLSQKIISISIDIASPINQLNQDLSTYIAMWSCKHPAMGDNCKSEHTGMLQFKIVKTLS